MLQTIIIGAIITLVGIFAFSRIDSSNTDPNVSADDPILVDDDPIASDGTQEVEIDGEVNHPGVYYVDPTQTLGDLIDMAGGTTEDADEDAFVSSYVIGERDYFYIPSTQGEICEPIESAKVNINDTTLTAEEFKEALDITISQAQGILDYRQENGSFSCIEELLEVKGIGEKTYEKIRGLVTLR